MSQYDVAIGMNQAELGKGASQLFADPAAREKLFKGTEEGTQNTLVYQASWDIQAPPSFLLQPPASDQWAQSIDKKGNHPDPGTLPTVNAFQLVFPQFFGSYTMGSSKPVSGTTKVIVIASASIQEDLATIAPLAVWLDETAFKGWDKFILNRVILPRVLQQAEQLLAGMRIPPLSLSRQGAEIDLTSPVVSIGDGRLILAASLKRKQTVSLDGATWPDLPFFVLMSPDVLVQAATGLAQSQLVNKTFGSKEDINYKEVLKISWSAKVNSVQTIQPHDDDRTKLSAQVGFDFSATLKPLGIGGPCAVTAATKSF